MASVRWVRDAGVWSLPLADKTHWEGHRSHEHCGSHNQDANLLTGQLNSRLGCSRPPPTAPDRPASSSSSVNSN